MTNYHEPSCCVIIVFQCRQLFCSAVFTLSLLMSVCACCDSTVVFLPLPTLVCMVLVLCTSDAVVCLKKQIPTFIFAITSINVTVCNIVAVSNVRCIKLLLPPHLYCVATQYLTKQRLLMVSMLRWHFGTCKTATFRQKKTFMLTVVFVLLGMVVTE